MAFAMIERLHNIHREVRKSVQVAFVPTEGVVVYYAVTQDALRRVTATVRRSSLFFCRIQLLNRGDGSDLNASAV